MLKGGEGGDLGRASEWVQGATTNRSYGSNEGSSWHPMVQSQSNQEVGKE